MALINGSVSFYTETGGKVGVFVSYNVGGVHTPQYRIYPDGGTAGAWINLPITGGVYVSNFGIDLSGISSGVYILEVKDSEGMAAGFQVGKIPVYDLPSETCFSDPVFTKVRFGYVTFNTSSSKLVRFYLNLFKLVGAGPPPPQTIQVAVYSGDTFRNMNVTSVGSPVSDEAGKYLLDIQHTVLDGLAVDVIPILPEVTFKRVSSSCTTTQFVDVQTFISAPTPAELPELEAVGAKTDVTVNAGADGTITLSVSGGSGSYTFLWNDAVTTQNRTGLIAGIYSVTVTDSVTLEEIELSFQINEPTLVPPSIGTIFDVPMMNSLEYVVDPVTDPDNSETFQTTDNTLLENQYFPGFTPGCYSQKVIKDDKPITQIISNYPQHTATLYKQYTNELIKTFEVILKEENIGKIEEHPITIRNYIDNPGKSRVYFNVGVPPIPLEVGDSFEVINNVDGFNGTYSIIDIVYDTSLGVPFLVINLNYTALTPTSICDGRFDASTVDFNIFEFVSDFSDVDNGKYYIKILAADGITPDRIAISEPIDLKVNHPKTVLIEYINVDNAYDITWTTGYVGRIRVEGILMKRNPGGERTVSRNSDFSLVKVSARKQRIFEFQTYMLPAYLHEKISVLMDCDFWSINKVQYQTSEGYAAPDYVDRFMLSDSSVSIEQVGWFDKYNSNDLGTTGNTGQKLATEDSFIKI